MYGGLKTAHQKQLTRGKCAIFTDSNLLLTPRIPQLSHHHLQSSFQGAPVSFELKEHLDPPHTGQGSQGRLCPASYVSSGRASAFPRKMVSES